MHRNRPNMKVTGHVYCQRKEGMTKRTIMLKTAQHSIHLLKHQIRCRLTDISLLINSALLMQLFFGFNACLLISPLSR